MKFLKPWLQDYIVETLPEDKVIVDALNKKAFEVEEVVATDAGTVFDIKVLPNRAHDSLGHHGMAYELCATLGLTFKKDPRVKNAENINTKISSPLITIEDVDACSRFASVVIENVTVTESPLWLKERLQAIGQRSINNIVDITNYVQFSLNKPMHAYDARTVKGALTARFAKSGETLLTLDDKSLTLDDTTLVISDDEKVLGLAGIKGGKYSGIQSDTTKVILESANFKPTLIRKTTEKYGIKTDASKRFENGIANNLVIEGLHMTANLIKEICGAALRSEITDIYPKKDTPYQVWFSKNEVNSILGTNLSDEDIKNTLNKLSFPFEVLIPQQYMENTYPTLFGAGYKNPSSMREDAPHAFSCSSLVTYLYKGIWMPSLSIDKYAFCKKIKKEDLQFGDLIFTNTNEGKIRYKTVEYMRGTKVPEGIDHVAFYLGNNKVIHATKVKGMVVEEGLDEHLSTRTLVGYGRVTDNLDEERYVVRVPSVRLDLRIKEDLAEEIGRIVGYNTLTPVLPKLGRAGLPHKRMYYENKIKQILFENSFSEVMNYTFGDHGEVTLVKGLAEDKEKLRSSLGEGMKASLALNLYNAPLLGQKCIKIFEFGNIFTMFGEKRHLALAIDDGGKKTSFTDEVDMILAEIKRTLGLKTLECQTVSGKPYVIEIDFDDMIAILEEPKTYETPPFVPTSSITYKTVSPYPFISRDIAMWVPENVAWEDIEFTASQVSNPLITRMDLFDTFSKEMEGVKKTSYAFRLVFQSHEKTLTDEEVNEMMKPYYEAYRAKGYEIR